MSGVEAVRWAEGGVGVDILDQTRLPAEERRLVLGTAEEVAAAIRDMRVRGAPAIGVAAALGLAADAALHAGADAAAFRERLERSARLLAGARPTAANLRWAVERLMAVARSVADAGPAAIALRLREEASAILEEDRAMCRRIGELGAALLPASRATVLTHCNAGALATSGIGTALAPVYVAHERGARVDVLACETRPRLQGARLTAWELRRAGIDVTLLVDGSAAARLREAPPDIVLVGADRIAANGDVANKIGTYALALAAQAHGVPFVVAAPWSTVDLDTPDGGAIPIEERAADEVTAVAGVPVAAPDVRVWAPAFDVTPAGLVSAIVTDRGVVRPPYGPALAELAGEEAEVRG